MTEYSNMQISIDKPKLSIIKTPMQHTYNGKLELPTIPDYNADMELDSVLLSNNYPGYLKNENLTTKISQLHELMAANKKEYSMYNSAVMNHGSNFLARNLKNRINKIKNTTEIGHNSAFTVCSRPAKEYFNDKNL